SVNAIQNNQWDGTVPGWFSDAHDRSYVLAYDTGQPEPDVSECPGPDGPPDQTEVFGNPSASAAQQCVAEGDTLVGGTVVTYTFKFPAVVLGENEFVNPVTFVYIDANGVQQEVVMEAGDADEVITVTYVEDYNEGSVSVAYGVKGQILTQLVVDTDCVTPPVVIDDPPVLTSLPITGVIGLPEAILGALALLGFGLWAILAERKRRKDENGDTVDDGLPLIPGLPAIQEA
ncbi:MAG: hypothetical protein WAO28_04690, partial [Candidatus Microsaccharimonas sp.]